MGSDRCVHIMLRVFSVLRGVGWVQQLLSLFSSPSERLFYHFYRVACARSQGRCLIRHAEYNQFRHRKARRQPIIIASLQENRESNRAAGTTRCLGDK